MTTPTPLQQLARMNCDAEMNTRSNELAQLAKFILSSGSLSKAALAVQTQGSKVGLNGEKLAPIIEVGGIGQISREMLRTKAAASPLTQATFSAITRDQCWLY